MLRNMHVIEDVFSFLDFSEEGVHPLFYTLFYDLFIECICAKEIRYFRFGLEKSLDR